MRGHNDLPAQFGDATSAVIDIGNGYIGLPV